ncbi:MAG TPA: 16S rRNA (guanine(966)-N(2))-methyltransferase RsmD [Vicinamibacterales bacterium]|nr:16S rRNA (guanine(966)-N(2))-methyltransferase RsmD [Vicinamibacterales bacterium]
MRIIAGTLKGRRLDAPDWPGLRPTSDRLRETLFNVLAPRIEGVRFLDAFAGTGAVGIEALSRGASHVTFVEQDPRAQRLIEANLARCGVSDRHAIIRAGFAAAAGRLPGPFQILFLDPPYGAAELVHALETAAPLVAGGAVLIVEHAKRDPAPEVVAGLVRTRALVQGDSALTFFQRSAFSVQSSAFSLPND